MTFLESSKERFSHGVVIAVANAHHALPDPVGAEYRTDTMICVLFSTVRMKDKSRLHFSSGESHLESFHHRCGSVIACPTIRREHMSSTVVRYSHPSAVSM